MRGDYKTENDGISGTLQRPPVTLLYRNLLLVCYLQLEAAAGDLYGHAKLDTFQPGNHGEICIGIAWESAKLKAIEPVTDRIFLHGAIWNTHQVLTAEGWELPTVQRVPLIFQKNNIKVAWSLHPICRRNALDESLYTFQRRDL